MNTRKSQGTNSLGWAPTDACTLPIAERPRRLTEFDDLFATLRTVEQTDPSHARLLLVGDVALAERAKRLAVAESACCSFFTFGVATPEPGRVVLDIEVPPAYADVLAGLVTRAEARQGTAS